MSKTYDDSYPQKNVATEVTDEQLKKQVVQQSIKNDSYKFPTETVELPSKGLGYSKDNLLSSGKIEMKYMTAKEEDILTSINLIKKGTVLDKLFESLIVSPINYNDLLIGDKNAVMVAARILGYGADYRFDYTCPNCDHKETIARNLSDITNKNFDEKILSQLGNNGFLEWQLPASKRKITFVLPNHKIEESVRREITAKRKINKNQVDPEITTRFKHMIQSVDGDDSKQYIINFVDNEFLSRDSFAFREYVRAISPDVDFTFEHKCSNCGHETTLALPIDAGFFWPDSTK